MSTAYEYDGTFEGFLTVVFCAFRDRRTVSAIASSGRVQNDIFSQTERVVTDHALSARVQKGICEKLGASTYHDVSYAFLNCASDKEETIYAFLHSAFYDSKDARSRADCVNAKFFKLRDEVGREVEHLRGFCRFSQTKAGFLYAAISPKHNVLQPLMAHFVGRLRSIAFVIYDKNRALLGAYDTKNKMVVSAKGFEPPPVTEDEIIQRTLWKRFFDSVAIKERANPRCQLNMLPKRYRKDMTEFQP
ncbi:MAG: TIGR03915 family putative DNA repair protein [Clostridia bacterium]|nr:TIGR03915 family putative DNA repair protein [Clostridia bacterium]